MKWGSGWSWECGCADARNIYWLSSFTLLHKVSQMSALPCACQKSIVPNKECGAHLKQFYWFRLASAFLTRKSASASSWECFSDCKLGLKNFRKSTCKNVTSDALVNLRGGDEKYMEAVVKWYVLIFCTLVVNWRGSLASSKNRQLSF